MRILNLYAGIGGNRKLWGDNHEITAVEIDPVLCEVYKRLYPKDEVICGDAIDFLEKNFQKFDFIWASPSCLSHTRMNLVNAGVRYKRKNMTLNIPDMKLYGLIIFLQKIFRGKWVVENVVPYYKPLVEPTVKIGRHIFWSNFDIAPLEVKETFYNMNTHKNDKIHELAEYHELDTALLGEYKFKGITMKKALKNCVKQEVGLHILEESQRLSKLSEQKK